jgi:hypothetical protein
LGLSLGQMRRLLELVLGLVIRGLPTAAEGLGLGGDRAPTATQDSRRIADPRTDR